MRVLFVTSRNAYSTSGELRLIKNRFITLKNQYDAQIDVINLRHKKALSETQEELGVNTYVLITHQWFNYYSRFREVKRTMTSMLTRDKYDVVILSGMNVLPLIRTIKKNDTCPYLVADLHGAYEELIEFPRKDYIANLKRKIFYYLAKRIESKYLNCFDAFFVVSRALQSYIETEYNIKGKKFFIIPCAISDLKINVDDCCRNRAWYRKKYGISDDEILFIYSGGVSPWQCIEESVRMFMRLKNLTNKRVKLLLLSGNKHAILKYQAEGVLIDSYSGDEVRKVLCAADYAFMLRQDLVTNKVAYPNKFLEYVSAGLQIVTTTAVCDIAKQIEQYKVGSLVDLNGDIDPKSLERRLPYLQDVDNRNALLRATAFETTLVPFVDFIEKK